MALLHHYKGRVRPFKCGPDFIDPQFHARIAGCDSINLDGYMMNEAQLQWLFSHYFDKEVAIIEGVMGYYDGMDKDASAYDVAKQINASTLLLLDGAGSYITLAAILKGMCTFRKSNTIKGVIINNVSSAMHYALIKKHIESEIENIVVCGWIQKGLKPLESTHLGLDLQTLALDDLEIIAQEVLQHIDIAQLESIMAIDLLQPSSYPFATVQKREKKCALVKDENFSFIYYDNIAFLREVYAELLFVDATNDESIAEDVDIVILPGGYVETPSHYAKIENSATFKASLIRHAKRGGAIYAECAGLIYLGESCDEKSMSAIMPISFTLTDRRQRLGYYLCELGGELIKGHAFHYSKITHAPKSDITLYKTSKEQAKVGAFCHNNIFGTYLHTMWRIYPELVLV